MDDKWKGSDYNPQKAWDEVTRPQREEQVRKWADKHSNGNLGLQLWGAVLLGLFTLLCIGGFLWWFTGFAAR